MYKFASSIVFFVFRATFDAWYCFARRRQALNAHRKISCFSQPREILLNVFIRFSPKICLDLYSRCFSLPWFAGKICYWGFSRSRGEADQPPAFAADQPRDRVFSSPSSRFPKSCYKSRRVFFAPNSFILISRYFPLPKRSVNIFLFFLRSSQLAHQFSRSTPVYMCISLLVFRIYSIVARRCIA